MPITRRGSEEIVSKLVPRLSEAPSEEGSCRAPASATWRGGFEPQVLHVFSGLSAGTANAALRRRGALELSK